MQISYHELSPLLMQNSYSKFILVIKNFIYWVLTNFQNFSRSYLDKLRSSYYWHEVFNLPSSCQNIFPNKVSIWCQISHTRFYSYKSDNKSNWLYALAGWFESYLFYFTKSENVHMISGNSTGNSQKHSWNWQMQIDYC